MITGLDIFVLIIFITIVMILIIIEIELYHQVKAARKLREQNWANLEKKYEERGYGILHKAYRKAQMILGRAELEQVRLIADNKYLLQKFQNEYKKDLNSAETTLKTNIQTELTGAEADFQTFLNDLKARSIKTDEVNQQFIHQRTNEIFTKLESNLGVFLKSTEQKSTLAVQQELQAARQLIDIYKTQQLTFIDENIVSILERTLGLVLIKKMTLKDQLDLVYEALEQAKIEKFIV